MAKATINELASLVAKLHQERTQHLEAIAEIDEVFARYGVSVRLPTAARPCLGAISVLTLLQAVTKPGTRLSPLPLNRAHRSIQDARDFLQRHVREVTHIDDLRRSRADLRQIAQSGV